MSDMVNSKEAPRIIGTSALQPEAQGPSTVMEKPEKVDRVNQQNIREFKRGEISEDQSVVNAEIGGIKSSLSSGGEGVLGRGEYMPAEKQRQKTSGGDRTGGRKKGIGVRITAGIMAGVAAVGIGYGVAKDKINSFLGIGGTDVNNLPPEQTISAAGVMESQNTPTPSEAVVASKATENIETPSPSPELSPEEQKIAVINKEIQDYLDGVGDYQDHRMDLGSLRFPDGSTTEAADLGIINYNLDIQGCLIDFIEKGDYIFLVTGFENKNEERFVTTLAIAKYFYEDTGVLFGFTEGTTTSDCTALEENYNHKVMLFYLNKLKGKVCGFALVYKKTSEKELRNYGCDFDLLPRYVEEANGSIEFAKRLLNTVATNDLENRAGEIRPEFLSIWKQSFGVVEPIIGLNKIDYELLSGLDVPFIAQKLHSKNYDSVW